MIDVNSVESLLDSFAKQGIDIPAEYWNKISSRLNDIIQYEPMVGVFGKTGAGKSSLCNALFGRDICPISDIAACTRETQQVRLNIAGKGMTLLDVPGVGESGDRDTEYDALYRQWLPKLDLVLWIVNPVWIIHFVPIHEYHDVVVGVLRRVLSNPTSNASTNFWTPLRLILPSQKPSIPMRAEWLPPATRS